MELETRAQAAENARRQAAERLNEMSTKHQRTVAKQVLPSARIGVPHAQRA